MKTYKYSIIAMAILSMMSCGDDEFSREYQDTEAKTELVGTLTPSRTKATAGSLIAFSVTIPQSFDTDASVEVSAIAGLSDLEVNQSVSKAYVTIAAGETTGTGSIAMPGSTSLAADFFGIADYAKMSISGIALAEGDDPYVMTSDATFLTFLQTNGNYNAPYPVDYASAAGEGLPGWNDGVIEPWLVISLDWADSDNVDLDLYVLDSSNQTYESSESGSRFENDFFNGNWFPDGEYGIYVSFYGTPTAVDYMFTATDQNGTVTQIEGVADANGFIGTINKLGGESNDITYVIEAL